MVEEPEQEMDSKRERERERRFDSSPCRQPPSSESTEPSSHSYTPQDYHKQSELVSEVIETDLLGFISSLIDRKQLSSNHGFPFSNSRTPQDRFSFSHWCSPISCPYDSSCRFLLQGNSILSPCLPIRSDTDAARFVHVVVASQGISTR